MNIALPLEIEKKITLLAQEAGVSVIGYLSAVVSELPEPKSNYRHRLSTSRKAPRDVSAKLLQWQTEEGTALRADSSARELFSKWKTEDALTTEQERQREYALWREIEQSLHSQRGLVL